MSLLIVGENCRFPPSQGKGAVERTYGDNDQFPPPNHEPDHDGEKFEYHYPAYFGYDIRGNGFTVGDSYPWVFTVRTNEHGLGSFRVQFPTKATMHPYSPGAENWSQEVIGWVVIAMFADRAFTFRSLQRHKHSVGRFSAATYKRDGGLLLEFQGPDNTESIFYVQRLIQWGGLRKLPVDVPDDGAEHGDL